MEGFRKNDFEVKWRIENADPWLRTINNTLYSHQFLAETLENTRWKLRLSTNQNAVGKYLILTVQRDKSDNAPEFVTLKYELSFLASDETSLKSKTDTMKFASGTISQELINFFYGKEKIHLPGNTLTVCCRFWKGWSTVSTGGKCSIQSVIGEKTIIMEGAIDKFNEIDETKNMTVNFTSLSPDIAFISFDVQEAEDNYLNFERIQVECSSFSMYSCKLFYLNNRIREEEICRSCDLSTLLTSYKSCKFLSFDTSQDYEYALKNEILELQLEITYYPGVKSENVEYDATDYTKTADAKNVNTSGSENVSGLPQSESEKEQFHNIDAFESGFKDDSHNHAGSKHLPSTTLKNDLSSLFNDRLFCDTKLRTDTETFPAHRNILSARSPVFKKMFSTDMKEASGEGIYIPDISAETVSRMLQFLYTDYTEDLEMQSAVDLYVASDKYDVASLKQRCLSFMKRNLCPANVCDVLLLADTHQDKDLESAAQEFVLTYDKEVFGSEEWKSFMKKFSGIAAQVMFLKCMKE